MILICGAIVDTLSAPLFSGAVGALSLLIGFVSLIIGILSLIKIKNVEAATAKVKDKMLFNRIIADNRNEINQVLTSLTAANSLEELSSSFSTISPILTRVADTDRTTYQYVFDFLTKYNFLFYNALSAKDLPPDKKDFSVVKADVIIFFTQFMNDLERNQ